MKKMLKREIEQALTNMENEDYVAFHSGEYNGYRTDQVTRKGNNSYTLYSFGAGWYDQISETFSTEALVKILWNNSLHTVL